MTIYIINLLLILMYAIIYNNFYSKCKNKKKLKKSLIIIITIQLGLILALRHYTIGTDVIRYKNNFLNLPIFDELFYSSRYEIGYKYLNKLIAYFTQDFQVFLAILSFIIIIPVSRFIYKYSKYPILSFLIYLAFDFYSFTFSGLRQSIAFSILLISYDFIIRKKLLKFIILVFIASLFHFSALVFLPAYILNKIKLNKYIINMVFLISAIIFFLRKQIYVFTTRFFYSNFQLVESNAYEWMLLCMTLVLLGLIFYKKVIDNSNEKNNLLYMMVIVGASLMIFTSVGNNVIRIANYYFFFIIIFIPEVINSLKSKKIMLPIYFLITLFFIILYMWFLNKDGYQIVPYKFFWSNNI